MIIYYWRLSNYEYFVIRLVKVDLSNANHLIVTDNEYFSFALLTQIKSIERWMKSSMDHKFIHLTKRSDFIIFMISVNISPYIVKLVVICLIDSFHYHLVPHAVEMNVISNIYLTVLDIWLGPYLLLRPALCMTILRIKSWPVVCTKQHMGVLGLRWCMVIQDHRNELAVMFGAYSQ